MKTLTTMVAFYLNYTQQGQRTECEHIIGPTDAVLTGIRAKLFKIVELL